MLLHPETRHHVRPDHIIERHSGSPAIAGEVDTAAQKIRLIKRVIAAGTHGKDATMGPVHVQKAVILNPVTAAGKKHGSIGEALQGIAGNHHTGGIHTRVVISKHDAIVRSGVCAQRLQIDAGIPGDRTIVKSIEVNALPVHIGKAVPRVQRLVHIAGGIESHCHTVALHIHKLHGKAQFRPRIMLDSHPRGVANLYSIPPHRGDGVVADDAIRLARGTRVRMRPDGIAGDAGDEGTAYQESVHAFFQKNAT